MEIAFDLGGVITLSIALAVLILSGAITLEQGFRELEGKLLVLTVIVVVALLSMSVIGSVYAFREMICPQS